MTKLYYVPLRDEQFKELKEKAIEIWNTFNDTFGYASENIDRTKNIENIGNDFMYIVNMFSIHNQKKLAEKLSKETRLAIRERMIDGEIPLKLIKF